MRLKITKESAIILLFWSILIFQVTELRYIWGIQSVGMLVNLSIFLLLTIFGITSVFSYQYSPRIWYFYIIPGLLVFLGMFLNITYNVVNDISLLSFYGLCLPWSAFLAALFFYKGKAVNIELLWKHFYYFMIVAVFLSLIEYFLVLAGGYPVKRLEVPNGIFLIGRFTLFHMLEDESPHYRFYACFGEPGSLAMLLLPALAYAFFYKRLIGMVIFSLALYYTGSLGGIFGIIMLIVILPIFYMNKRFVLLSLIFCFVLFITFLVVFKDTLSEQYEEKGGSRTTREESFQRTITNLSTAVLIYPFGLPLELRTEDAENNNLYFGSNFTPGYAYVLGGLLAFWGYIISILVSAVVAFQSLFKKVSKIDKVVFISIIVLLPFIFQRATIWDSALYSLLFSPILLRYLDSIKKPAFKRNSVITVV